MKALTQCRQLHTVSCSLAIWFLLHVPSLIFNIWQFTLCSGFSVPPSRINQTSLLLLHLLPRSVLCKTMKHTCTILFLNVGSEKIWVLYVFLKAAFIYFQYFHIYIMFLIKLIVLTGYLQTAGKPASTKQQNKKKKDDATTRLKNQTKFPPKAKTLTAS